jgi:type VI secretion system VasD/TssJ family lipoprotein
MMNVSMRSLTWAVLAAALAAAGCKGTPCVAKGDQIVVDLSTSPDLNDTGAGPQHVRYQVWAISNPLMFQNASPAALTEADKSGGFQQQQLGRPFLLPTESNWIQPGVAARRLVLGVDMDEQFTHVGIVVNYANPTKLLVPLDCKPHEGYSSAKPYHNVAILLLRDRAMAAAQALGVSR